MSVISRNWDKDTLNNFKCNAKTHASTDKKNFVPVYAEHLRFILTRTSWLVTKIYQHFTIEQSEFRKVFNVMNQKSRQKATSSVEYNSYKLLNDANFEIDYTDNINNCYFEPIYDEIGEISYIKMFDSIFDNEQYHNFCDKELMKEEVKDKYNGLILALDPFDLTYEAEKYFLQSKKEIDLDSIESISAHTQKTGKKRSFFKIEKKIQNVLKSKTTNMIVDFSCAESASIKSFAIKKIIKPR